MNTIITVTYTNYSENIIVTAKNANELRELVKTAKSYKVAVQGDFHFLETERAEDYVALENKIEIEDKKLRGETEMGEDESYRTVRNMKDYLRKEQNRIYLRKIDKAAINDFYTCEVV